MMPGSVVPAEGQILTCALFSDGALAGDLEREVREVLRDLGVAEGVRIEQR
jgi:hypothetical protein